MGEVDEIFGLCRLTGSRMGHHDTILAYPTAPVSRRRCKPVTTSRQVGRRKVAGVNNSARSAQPPPKYPAPSWCAAPRRNRRRATYFAMWRSPTGGKWLAVFVGGALGTLARAVLSHVLAVPPGHWPWATFLVNIVGAALLGYFTTRLLERLPASGYRRPLLGTGLCGGLTTFSTMQVEVLVMLEHGSLRAGRRLHRGQSSGWGCWRCRRPRRWSGGCGSGEHSGGVGRRHAARRDRRGVPAAGRPGGLGPVQGDERVPGRHAGGERSAGRGCWASSARWRSIRTPRCWPGPRSSAPIRRSPPGCWKPSASARNAGDARRQPISCCRSCWGWRRPGWAS